MKNIKRIRRRLFSILYPILSIPTTDSTRKKSTIKVDGHQLWIKSENIDADFNSEALASAFIIPAALANRKISGKSIDCKWLENSRKIIALISDWWNLNKIAADFEACHTATEQREARTALAFSLGVDSFYSCFFSNPRPDILVFVAGFDVPLENLTLLETYKRSLQQVAQACNMQWAIVSTNLRKHQTFRRASWAYSHGGALAFIGHLLKPTINTLIISSSYHREHLDAYGSHPELDQLWSSTDLKVMHFGDDVMRSEKLKKLLSHSVARDLVAKNLRVCWEHPGLNKNCGHCAKCVLTRINLVRDAPDLVVETMPTDIPLVEAINALKPMDLELSLNFRRELIDIQDQPVRDALLKYIQRSEAAIAQATTKKI